MYVFVYIWGRKNNGKNQTGWNLLFHCYVFEVRTTSYGGLRILHVWKYSFLKYEKYVNLCLFSLILFYMYTLYILADLTVDHKPSEAKIVWPVSKIFWKLWSYGLKKKKMYMQLHIPPCQCSVTLIIGQNLWNSLKSNTWLLNLAGNLQFIFFLQNVCLKMKISLIRLFFFPLGGKRFYLPNRKKPTWPYNKMLLCCFTFFVNVYVHFYYILFDLFI